MLCGIFFGNTWHFADLGKPANVRFAPIVLKKSARELLGWYEEASVRQFVSGQAGIGAGSGINFASFRRFWTVAASRNSS